MLEDSSVDTLDWQKDQIKSSLNYLWRQKHWSWSCPIWAHHVKSAFSGKDNKAGKCGRQQGKRKTKYKMDWLPNGSHRLFTKVEQGSEFHESLIPALTEDALLNNEVLEDSVCWHGISVPTSKWGAVMASCALPSRHFHFLTHMEQCGCKHFISSLIFFNVLLFIYKPMISSNSLFQSMRLLLL